MSCLMVAVPLAATLYTAIIRWKQKEVSSAESLNLISSLNVYGTVKDNDSTRGQSGEGKTQ